MDRVTDSTVVIPTRGDRAAWDRITADIVPAAPGPVMVIVNDPNAAGHIPAAVPPQLQVRICPGGGVARARNLALRCAGTDDIIFIDDDVVATTTSLRTLHRTLTDTDAAIVTARVLPHETETIAGQIHTHFLGLDRGPTSQTFTADTLGHITPTTVWQLGVGALFAVKRSRLNNTATPLSFDESLSNGRFCGGAEDSDFFYQALIAGLDVTYEADAVVTHRYPSQSRHIARKMHQYARADGAFYAKHARRLPHGATTADLRDWVTRTSQHLRHARRHQIHPPLRPLLTEPLDKAIGIAWWYTIGRA